jgi:hypothetical protein
MTYAAIEDLDLGGCTHPANNHWAKRLRFIARAARAWTQKSQSSLTGFLTDAAAPIRPPTSAG